MLFNPLIEHAIELAAEWHDATYRKSRWRPVAFVAPVENVLRVPVMAHLTAVALTLQRAGWDDTTIAAAYLHDILEDENQFGGTMSVEVLAARMGPEVAHLVQSVTEPKTDEHGQFYPWQYRKEVYLRQLEEAPVEALAISLADKLHNLWTMNQGLEAGVDIFTGTRHADGKRQGLSAGADAQRWYFGRVLEIARHRQDDRLTPLIDTLQEEVQRFERLLQGLNA